MASNESTTPSGFVSGRPELSVSVSVLVRTASDETLCTLKLAGLAASPPDTDQAERMSEALSALETPLVNSTTTVLRSTAVADSMDGRRSSCTAVAWTAAKASEAPSLIVPPAEYASFKSVDGIGTFALKAIVIVSVVEVSDETDDTARPAASAPDRVQCEASLSELETGSLNDTVIALSAVSLNSAVGAMPSETGMPWRAASALESGSSTAPEPEPGSPVTSVPDVSYLSSTPSGFVSAKALSSVSTMESEPDEVVLETTTCEAASVPDTDQPCAVASDMLRGSLKVTLISVSETAAADDIVGAMPSDTGMLWRASRALAGGEAGNVRCCETELRWTVPLGPAKEVEEDALSAMSPEPEPESAPTSVPDVS